MADYFFDALVAAATATPPPYKRKLAYISQTYRQYINTGITARSGLKTEVQFMPTQSGVDNDIAGAFDGTNRFFAPCLNSGKFMFGYITGSLTSVDYAVDQLYTVQCDFTVGSQSMSINGDVVYTGSNTNSFTTNLPLFVMLRNQQGSPRTTATARPRIYYVKIWDGNDTLLFDGIPVMDWNDVPCMYDKVSMGFFYNPQGADFDYGEI